MRHTTAVSALLFHAALFLPAGLAAQANLEARLDSIFAPFNRPDAPGCAIGVTQHGRVVMERAWGMADLERGVANTPATIFEAGSVSKQFAAAAVLLLARDGRLALDDDVRRWVPELPDHGAPVTLRHMIHHVSGLRDWGSVSQVAGWGRDSRAIDMAHVLRTIARVRELNFPSGSEYDYSNTNYNLLAIVVERASGMSFPEFTRRRIFAPLGMTSTSWRDDATRVVRGRALSYNRAVGGEWRTARAIESIYGNCCLLTTVGDQLRWLAAFDSTRLGGAGLREEQERRGVLTGGRTITYAAGLVVDTWRGEPYVSHSGATAGYRAYTVRYPRQGLAVAVLCNAGNSNPTALGDSAALLFMTVAPPSQPVVPARAAVPAAAIQDKAGLYRNLRDMQAQRFVVREGRLEVQGGAELMPQSATEFAAARGGWRVHFDRRPDGRYDFRVVTASGDTVRAEAVDEPDTAAAARAQYVGTYYSDEADVRLVVADSGGVLQLRRFDRGGPMRAVYRDGFMSPLGVVVFTRAGASRVDGFRLTLPRVRNLRFRKTG